MRVLDLPIAGLILLLAVAATGATASPVDNEVPGIPDTLMSNAGFLNAHPDLRHRRQGSHEYVNGRFGKAAAEFERAARHADKPSQAMLGEIHWDGSGVKADRALAYAWMDLASERGYRQFLLRREAMWSQLDAAEQSRAIEVGQAIYDRYGDRVAKPRLEAEMRREFRRATGSRINPGHLKLGVGTRVVHEKSAPAAIIDDVSLAGMTPAHDFYDDRYWVPSRYWELQDAQWLDRPAHEVIVRPLQNQAMEPVR